MMNYKNLLVAVFFIVLSGCVTMSSLYINQNGDIQRCGASGSGIVGMTQASGIMSDCERDMRKAGYLKYEMAGAIGIDFSESKNDSLPRVLRVYENSPAKDSGIHSGDRILSIDSNLVYSTADAKKLLFGEYGTLVTVVVLRDTMKIPFKMRRAPYARILGSLKK